MKQEYELEVGKLYYFVAEHSLHRFLGKCLSVDNKEQVYSMEFSEDNKEQGYEIEILSIVPEDPRGMNPPPRYILGKKYLKPYHVTEVPWEELPLWLSWGNKTLALDRELKNLCS